MGNACCCRSSTPKLVDSSLGSISGIQQYQQLNAATFRQADNQAVMNSNRCCKWCCSCCCITLVVALIALAVCASKTRASDISEKFIEANLNDNPIFGWWSLDALQPKDVLDELNEKLVNHTQFQVDIFIELWGEGIKDLIFGYGSAEQVANMMYKATRVEGVWEKVPEKFRGVFWMKGNGVGEELTVLQYGSWFEEEQTLLVPMAPFTWGWPGGTPAEAPYDGLMYNVTRFGALALLADGKPGVAYSYVFGPCPSGKACQAGSDDLSFASLQAHFAGDLRVDSVNMKTMIPLLPDAASAITGKFTLEELPGKPPGSHWMRRCVWGVGACDCIEFGSYDLVKIIDGDGDPIEPAYSDFLEYMGDVPLFVWSDYDKSDERPQ